jgi:putative endonuclease
MSFALALERRLYTRLRAHADRRQARQAIIAGRRPKPSHLLTGERGEDAAFFHLRSLGYTIVARRWRAERLRGDLDLVGWDGDTLVLFEIKTLAAGSSGQTFAPAETAVDHPKQKVLRRMAAAYLRQLPEPHRDSVPLRFDVLSVYLQPAARPRFEHFRNAFPVHAPQNQPRR